MAAFVGRKFNNRGVLEMILDEETREELRIGDTFTIPNQFKKRTFIQWLFSKQKNLFNIK